MYVYIYIYFDIEFCVFNVGSLCFDFSVVQCSIRRSRARYILRERKNKETLFSSLQAFFVITHSSGEI